MADLMSGIMQGTSRLKKVIKQEEKKEEKSAGIFCKIFIYFCNYIPKKYFYYCFSILAGTAVKKILARRAAICVHSDSEDDDNEWN